MNEFVQFVLLFLSDKECVEYEPDVEEYIVNLPFNEHRKQEYRDAAEENLYNCPPDKSLHSVEEHAKQEAYDSFKPTRLINARCDRAKIWFGPWTKKIEEIVYSWTSPDGKPYFAKHIPVSERAKVVDGFWLPGARCIITDYTAFESHFVPLLMLACEICLFVHMLKKFPGVADSFLKADAGCNHIHSRLGLVFTILGRRMSGDMWTSLCNGFANLMNGLFIMHKLGIKGHLMVEGDDGIMVSYNGILPTAADYLKLGFTIKLAEYAMPTMGSFCGLSSDGVDNTRDPRRIFRSFGWTTSGINSRPRRLWQLLKAKALSLLYELPQCPISGVLARCALAKMPQGIDPIYEPDFYRACLPPADFVVPPFSPSMSLRLYYADAYNITIGEQLDAEKLIAADRFEELASILPPNDDMWKYDREYVRCRGTYFD